MFYLSRCEWVGFIYSIFCWWCKIVHSTASQKEYGVTSSLLISLVWAYCWWQGQTNQCHWHDTSIYSPPIKVENVVELKAITVERFTELLSNTW